MAVAVENLMVPGPVGMLEARLESVKVADKSTRQDCVAVICHPHPQFEGTMLNKVVHTLSRACTDLGISALRFNYRGVGRSEGQYDEGHGETDDAAAAIAYLTERNPSAKIVLAGFSFGSGVVLRLAQRQPPYALITVAPPVGRLGVPDDAHIESPWLVVQGSADELVNWQDVERWVQAQTLSPEWLLMPDVSHFFHGKLTVLRHSVSEFLRPLMDSAQAAGVVEKS